MSYTDYTPEEIASRGEAIYVEQIRDRLKPVHRGQFLVIDIETGEYKIDAGPKTQNCHFQLAPLRRSCLT